MLYLISSGFANQEGKMKQIFPHDEQHQHYWRIWRLDECWLWFHTFSILPSPCQWPYLSIPTSFCIFYHSLRRSGHRRVDPILCVNINRYVSSATMVVIWPMASQTWTMYMYCGLGAVTIVVAIVSFSWYLILWPIYVVECESRIVSLHDVVVRVWE